jgi:hypothetical protein
VFIEDNEEDIDDHQKIEELHKRRNFLASYCKLVVYNVLPTKVTRRLSLIFFLLPQFFSWLRKRHVKTRFHDLISFQTC